MGWGVGRGIVLDTRMGGRIAGDWVERASCGISNSIERMESNNFEILVSGVLMQSEVFSDVMYECEFSSSSTVVQRNAKYTAQRI